MRRALIALALPEMAAGVLLAWAVTNTSPEADPPVVDVRESWSHEHPAAPKE